MARSDAASHLRSPAVSERRAAGKRAREAVPRKAHAVWRPPAGRADPVGFLERQAETRVPELLPIRYGRMAAVAVRVLPRGGGDHGGRPCRDARGPGFGAQLCGDAHLSNFGGFAATRPRSSSSTSTTSTRRSRDRGSGTSSASAASVAVAGRDAGLGSSRAASRRDGRRPRVPGGDAGLRRDAATSTSGTRGSSAERHPRDASARTADKPAARSREARHGEGAPQGQRCARSRS